ncbi:MAG: S8/S53 family peptidase [Bacteroidota bacterium]|nr:S8/S53 family peptidase [Bacteroidota bacterium]
MNIALYGQNAKLSALTQRYLADYRNSKLNLSNSASHYLYKTINNRRYIGALIKVNGLLDEQKLIGLGVFIGTKAGDIWTAKVPEDKFKDFVLIEGIDYIQIDEPVSPSLYVARKTTRVDSVQKGILLPQPYTGKNVIMGIIDVGLDYTHPTFYDTSGNKYRIKRIWEQKSSGTPPSGFSYGNEITDTLLMLSAETDNKKEMHGTHVAGIAAGSGFDGKANSKYKGIAYESDIVYVGITPEQSQWTGGGLSDIIDGMNYIYRYAASQGKPAVVNLSWGCTIGPNDGTSLFNRACDNLTGAGKIFVVAAGNNGMDKIHLRKDFTTNDSVIKSFVTFDTLLPKKATWLDIWGDTGKVFTVQLSLYNDTISGKNIQFTCLKKAVIDTFMIGSHNDTCFFKLSIIPSDFNNKPHILLDIISRTLDNLCVGVTGKSGRVNMWLGYILDSHGYYGAFVSKEMPWASDGNSDMTLGEIACTNSAITVGAYVSKTDWIDVAGNSWSYAGYASLGRIAPFSSHGPTAGSQLKPDITAPGLSVVSSMSSFASEYYPGGTQYKFSEFKYSDLRNLKDYYYAEASGTSMASPVTSGIVALMLEVKPDLTPNEIKTILAKTAIKDNFTTKTPNQNIWGAGKINAYGAIKNTVSLINAIKQIDITSDLKVYPNPGNGLYTIEMVSEFSGEQYIEVYNLLGKVIYAQKWVTSQGINRTQVNMNGVARGTYLMKITSSQGFSVNKVIVCL